MKPGQVRLATGQRIRENLVPLTEWMQAINPECLLTRGYVTRSIAETLKVTRQAVSQNITKFVADGKFLEIFPKPYWRVDLPGGEDLPTVYAQQSAAADGVYELQYDKPDSRGAGQNSFLITPKALENLLPLVRKQLGLPQPSPDSLPFYVPDRDQMLRPEMYTALLKAYVTTSPWKATSSQAAEQLQPLLAVLRLRAPLIPGQRG